MEPECWSCESNVEPTVSPDVSFEGGDSVGSVNSSEDVE